MSSGTAHTEYRLLNVAVALIALALVAAGVFLVETVPALRTEDDVLEAVTEAATRAGAIVLPTDPADAGKCTIKRWRV